MTRTKTIIVAAVALGAIAVAAWMLRRARDAGDTGYRFATVELGAVLQTVSATGALSAVKTVQVGTQASGQVAEIHADFNDVVKKGQLLARIDPVLQQQAVSDAQAQLEKAKAQQLQAQQEYDRNEPLFTQQFISATEFGTMQVNRSVAIAASKSAQVTLDKAKQNLSYTNIYAPIDGVIVERDVDVGQTVAASLSAPQLFLIAQNLAQMQILAAVDESDISSIKDGQPARFTVESFPGRTFDGVVEQVRLQSKLSDNVVSYTVVVTLDNAGSQLLPGMTATVEFITGSATNVLTVPNAALRFTPTSEERAASGLPLTSPTSARGTADTPVAGITPAVRPRRAGGSQAGGAGVAGGLGGLWTLDSNQKLARLPVRVALSDGQRTQVSGVGIAAGTQVIIGSALATTSSQAAPSANPLAPAPGGGRRGGG